MKSFLMFTIVCFSPKNFFFIFYYGHNKMYAAKKKGEFSAKLTTKQKRLSQTLTCFKFIFILTNKKKRIE